MANNSHGNKNEVEISNYLNEKKFCELNLCMKEFIKYICKNKEILFNDDTIIYSSYEKNNKLKQDIYININNVIINVSLKMGSGNSLHQEKIEDFILFIKKELKASEEICNMWRFFIWADGTLNGTGPLDKNTKGEIICRFGSKEYQKKYAQDRVILQNFINENKIALIERALFIGKCENSNVDFVYHGTYKEGCWISKQEVINFQLENETKSKNTCFRLGKLTIQAWNVSLKGKTERKRGQIQFKYGSMKDDFNKLMQQNINRIGTFVGDIEEFELSHCLNKNKKNQMWKVILPNIDDFTNYYLVKVSSNQFSRLSEKKVKTKSDAYVIKANLPKDLLLSREYVIEESDLNDYDYEVQANSGISIKLKSSQNYTYQKFTKNSFYKAFAFIPDINFWFASLLIYSSKDEIYKNHKILSDIGFSFETFSNYVEKYMQITFKSADIQNSSYWESIRKKAQEKIKEEIQKNIELSESIFMGKHWFEAQYQALFIYEKGILRKNTIMDFSITTGSGRSKGKYSIEIKPN
ncbi:hypothetical protein J6R97_06365 [bacterium]|nr:hypothetical protein [bacterium]